MYTVVTGTIKYIKYNNKLSNTPLQTILQVNIISLQGFLFHVRNVQTSLKRTFLLPFRAVFLRVKEEIKRVAYLSFSLPFY